MSVLAEVDTHVHDRRQRRPRRWDLGLLACALLVVALVALAVYGPLLAPRDFWYTRALLDGKAPPYPPGPEFLLGSDEVGHDLLSWLLIGARTTLGVALAAALLRMAVGGFLGVFAGWQGGLRGVLLGRLALVFSSVPATILAVIGVIAFNVQAGALAFALALGLLGWGDAFHHARRHARSEAAKPFIESARTLGMSETRVVLRHLLPGIAPTLLTLTALQISAVLLVLGELGLLRIFIGDYTVVAVDTRSVPTIVMPSQPDWSSMLAATRPILTLFGSPWMLLAPAGALLSTVIAVNLVADVLARRAARLDVYRLFDPRWSAVFGVALTLLLLPALVWRGPMDSHLEFGRLADGARAYAVARELTDPVYEGLSTGGVGAERAASRLSELLGGELVPVEGATYTLASASVQGTGRAFAADASYSPLSIRDFSISGPLTDARGPDLPRVLSPTVFAGRILVAAPPRAENLVSLAVSTGALGLVIVDDNAEAYVPDAYRYPIPVVRIGTDRFRELTGTVPASLDPAAPPLRDQRLTLSARVEAHPLRASDVIMRIPAARADAPVLLIVAPYDTPARPRYVTTALGWRGASAAGAMSAIATALRAHPVPAHVVLVLTAADSIDSLGTQTALAALTEAERRQVAATVHVGGMRSLRPVVHVPLVDPRLGGEISAPSRVAGRVASALGVRMRAAPVPIASVLRSSGISAPIFAIDDSLDEERPGTQAELHASTRALLTLITYLAHETEELRQ